MNFKSVTASIPGLVLIAASVFAAPQEDDQIMKLGPNPELFNAGTIEIAMMGWEWQAELSRKQQELILQTVSTWEEKLKVCHAELAELGEQLDKFGLSSPIDIRSIQKIDEEIGELKSDASGLTAQLKKLEGDAKSAENRLQFERDSKQEEIELLQTKMMHAAKEHERATALFKKGSVSVAEVANIDAKVDEIKSMLRINVRELELIHSQLETDLSRNVLVVAEQREELRKRLEELLDKKNTIRKLEPIRKFDDINAEIKLAQRMIEMARTKQFELQLENTRVLALVELAEKRMAEFKSKQEDSGANDK